MLKFYSHIEFEWDKIKSMPNHSSVPPQAPLQYKESSAGPAHWRKQTLRKIKEDTFFQLYLEMFNVSDDARMVKNTENPCFLDGCFNVCWR